MMLHNSLLVFVTFNLVGGFDTTLSSCCPNKAVGGISYTLVEEGPTSQYGCEEECIYHPAGKPQDRVCFRPGALEAMCQPGDTDDIDEISGTYSNAQYKRSKEKTSIILALAQSKMFANLSESQQKAFYNVSKANGLELDPYCKLEKLTGCNNNQLAMQMCNSSVGTLDFVACVKNVCPECGCPLADLLGLQCDWGHTTRFLGQNKTTGVFFNLYFSQFEFDQDENITTFDITYDGHFEETKKVQDLKEDLRAHFTQFSSMFNWKMDLPSPDPGLTEMETIVAVAGQVVNIFNMTQDIILGGLISEIKKLNADVDGLTLEQKKLVQNAMQILGQSEININNANRQLTTLADESVHRVDQMLHYLGIIKDTATQKQVEAFLKFQAKQMTDYVSRVLNQLEETIVLYYKTQTDLNNVRAELVSFQNLVQNLANQNSQAHKDKVEAYRLALYIPFCGPLAFLTGGISCAAAVISLELSIADWEEALTKLNNLLDNNKKLTGQNLVVLEIMLNGMNTDSTLVFAWQIALLNVQEDDYTFPALAFSGFADAKVRVIESLNMLKTAALNYLARE